MKHAKHIHRILATITAVLLLNPSAVAQQQFNTEAQISLQALDPQGRPVNTFVAGEEVLLNWSYGVGRVPDKGSFSVAVTATFVTKLFGKELSYSINLPVKGSVGSRVNPFEDSSTFGEKIGPDFVNRKWNEETRFRIPEKTPEGKVIITVSVTASSAKPLVKKFSYKIVRP